MCGRYVLYGPENRIIEGFTVFELPPFTPRYNIAPTTDVLIVTAHQSGERRASLARWGLIPSWAKDPSIGQKLNNARAETVAEKPSFRQAFKRWRCLIPANGFYEWQTLNEPAGKSAKPRKQPYYIHAANDQLLAFAGLVERWLGPQGPVYSCCVITTEPNAVMQPIHERMPVILGSNDFARWLAPDYKQLNELKTLCRPCPNEWIAAHAVSSDVNYARNDLPQLLAPVAAAIPLTATGDAGAHR